MYELPENYKHRPEPKHHDDRKFTDKHQDYVYSRARQILEENSFNSVLDIGCGSAFKLMKHFRDVETLGLELEPSLSHVRSKYPDRRWEKSEIHTPPVEEFDIAICADVIEHIPDVDVLTAYLSKVKCKYLLISTPDRDLLNIRDKGRGFHGPPINPCHCREWTRDEFASYLGRFGIKVDEHLTQRKEVSQAVVSRRVP